MIGMGSQAESEVAPGPGNRADGARVFLPTRKSLLSRLKNWSDNASWEGFFETYWKLIYGVAVRSGLAHAEAQDVVQEVVLSVAKHIRSFEYDPKVCSFKGWLLHVTRSKIARQYARRGKQVMEAGLLTPIIEKLPDPNPLALEALWNEEWQKNLVDSALSRVKARVPMEHYQMFDLYVLKRRPAREVAHTLRVTVAHVYVTKHRLSRMVAKEIKALERLNQ